MARGLAQEGCVGTRILLVSGPAAGGLKRHVETLASRLPARGFEVAGAAPPGVFVEAVCRFPLDLGDRPRPGADLRTVRQLRLAAKQWKPDVVHAHGVKAALLTLFAFPTGRPPVVVTYHNVWHGGPLSAPLRLLAPRAAASIAVSGAVRDSLARHGVRVAHPEVIRNGVDPAAFPDVKTGRPPHPFTALFMGRLTEEKGIPVLLEAVEAAGEGPAISLVIAGDGPLRSRVEQAAARNAGRVRYVGHVSEVLTAYRQADVVVMPSLSEGLPMTALEAMACGLPLVASRVGGLPEVVADGETGLLVPPGDPSALAAALRVLAADPVRAAAMGDVGRARVADRFTEERMLEQLIACYHTALGPGASGRA